MKSLKVLTLPLALLTLTFVYLYFFQIDFLRTHFSQQHKIKNRNLASTYDPNDTQATWWRETSYSPRMSQTAKLTNPTILGVTSNKHIEIDLTNQRLYAYENGVRVFEFPISSGLYDWTPRGTFYTWIKLKYTKMEGGNRALGTYYYLPNVPYTMYFGNDQVPNWKGFGIHGAYWHNDFGRPKSHGCINLRPEDAEKLFYWAPPATDNKSAVKVTDSNPGIRIVIYGKYEG
jgi:lipoprotein-anchoring transpeptidase ErfK/SrfK